MSRKLHWKENYRFKKMQERWGLSDRGLLHWMWHLLKPVEDPWMLVTLMCHLIKMNSECWHGTLSCEDEKNSPLLFPASGRICIPCCNLMSQNKSRLRNVIHTLLSLLRGSASWHDPSKYKNCSVSKIMHCWTNTHGINIVLRLRFYNFSVV